MAQLLGLFPEELEKLITGMGEKKFRAAQVWEWLQRGVDFDDMKNVPATLRARLKEEHVACPVRIREIVRSAVDDTKKLLFEFPDANCVEGVIMHYHYGYSLCISTQVGCRMGCRFCASTLDGRVRDLTAAEMLGEYITAQNTLPQGERIGHVVLMGSGEPLDNYDETMRFIRLISHEKGQNLSVRHISLSTCGLVENMYRLAQEHLPLTLSLSLHAPNDSIRKQIMPIANRYRMEDVLKACRNYIDKTGRRVIFEYALIRDVNASVQCAQALADKLRGMQCHVNLIPLNTVRERNLIGVNEKEIRDFLSVLEKAGISATRRREMGDDIEGACGQLRKSRIEKEAGV